MWVFVLKEKNLRQYFCTKKYKKYHLLLKSRQYIVSAWQGLVTPDNAMIETLNKGIVTMLLTAKKAHELGMALVDAAERSRNSKQQYMILLTKDIAATIPFKEGCNYDPEFDVVVM